MSDSGIGVATTVTPSDSVSQVKPNTDKPKGGLRRKRDAKPPADKDAPQGAVQVPPGGQRKTGKSSAVQSATIPLTGWGEIDLHSHRNEIKPKFRIDANPYDDLITTVYNQLQSRYSTGARHLPFSLFRYYCFTMWWYRVLWLHKANGNLLDSEEKDFLSIFNAGEEFQIPSAIAQYLSNMGNFMQGGETFYFEKPSAHFGDIANVDSIGVERGWLNTGLANRRTNGTSWWLYTHVPVPGVYLTLILNDVLRANDANAELFSLTDLAPTHPNGDLPVDTPNIVGWTNNLPLAQHGSWRSTFSSLGWTETDLAPDCQTQFGLSTSTLTWMSERLATIKDYKLLPSRQITLSSFGNPLQAYYLDVDDLRATRQFDTPRDIDLNHFNGSLFTDCKRSIRIQKNLVGYMYFQHFGPVTHPNSRY
ncbi:hypothetical protein GGR56DRAFT_459630 [Xylariaceae sp. FL0804]|nr:hypothetical protein GGR56DRAFT_459630 [Xylariaceae sp. FL0804]